MCSVFLLKIDFGLGYLWKNPILFMITKILVPRLIKLLKHRISNRVFGLFYFSKRLILFSKNTYFIFQKEGYMYQNKKIIYFLKIIFNFY